MITRTPDTRDLHDARLKAKLDPEARLEYARAEGRAEREQIGQIRLFEEILGVSPTAHEELEKFGSEQLATRLAELWRILRERKG